MHAQHQKGTPEAKRPRTYKYAPNPERFQNVYTQQINYGATKLRLGWVNDIWEMQGCQNEGARKLNPTRRGDSP
jgi:hypothetical protein